MYGHVDRHFYRRVSSVPSCTNFVGNNDGVIVGHVGALVGAMVGGGDGVGVGGTNNAANASSVGAKSVR